MSEYVSAFDRCLDRSLPKGQQPRGEWMRADHDRIRALEAENARLRDALGEAIAEIERDHRSMVDCCTLGGDITTAEDSDAKEIDRLEYLLTRLRAAL